MTYEGDPYRVLGVAPGATVNEVKSAYRRLVKQWHPDTAGERALPRFLAIQAAYERLVDGEGRLRAARAGPGGTRPAGSGHSAGAARRGEPWRADPDRARASRDAWRARRAGWSAGSASGGAATGSGWAAGGAADGSASDAQGAGTGRRGDGRGADGGERGSRERRGHHRTTRKATPGSTTYDEAAEPLDPRWGGATWYGASSGTYWTINPREYADPRKHGPEYLARARRAAGARGVEPDGEPSAGAFGPAAPDTEAAGGAWGWSAEAGTRTQGDPHDWGARDWSYGSSGTSETSGAAPHRRPGSAAGSVPGERRRGSPASARARAGVGANRGPAVAPAPEPGLPDLEELVRRAFPANLRRLAERPGLRWRIALAFVGWPPIGYAAATLADAATGCGAFSAGCTSPLDLAAVAVQPVLVVLLAVVPGLAAAAAFAALAALVVALLAAFALALVAPVAPDLARTVLVAVVAGAWLVAFAGPAVRRRRAERR